MNCKLNIISMCTYLNVRVLKKCIVYVYRYIYIYIYIKIFSYNSYDYTYVYCPNHDTH